MHEHMSGIMGVQMLRSTELHILSLGQLAKAKKQLRDMLPDLQSINQLLWTGNCLLLLLHPAELVF